jgi:hypothetical protein
VQKLIRGGDTQSIESCGVDVDQATVEIKDLEAVATALDVPLSHLPERSGWQAAVMFGRVGVRGPFPLPPAEGGGARLESWRGLASTSRFLSPDTLHSEGDGGCDHARELDFLVIERVRGGIVEHELADHPAEADQRNETQSSDPFARKDRQVVLERRFARHVRDEQRLRVHRIGRPGRMSLDRRPILAGQPAIRLESHHTVGIEQQDGRP